MLLLTLQIHRPPSLPLTRSLFSYVELCVSTMIWLVSWSLSPSCMTALFGLRHETVVAGPPSVRQMIVNSGGLTLGSVCRVIANLFACSLPVTQSFYKLFLCSYMHAILHTRCIIITDVDVDALYHFTGIRYITSPQS